MATSKRKNRKNKSQEDKNIPIKFDNNVLQFIRQHARSTPQIEICGVLIGEKNDKQILVDGVIAGKETSQGDAHVTFTQETWVHIHKEKAQKYPEESIIGWYHSHPGFGVFLSQHDLFIHNNFFSDPSHIAWVFDPVSDEEGCFGWINGEVCRIRQFEVITNLDKIDVSKSLTFDIPSQKQNHLALLKRIIQKRWFTWFSLSLNILFVIIILILFYVLKGKRSENFNDNSKATKNKTEVLKPNDQSSSKNSDDPIHEEKANNPEI